LRYSKVDFGEALCLRFVSLLNQKLRQLHQSIQQPQSVFEPRRKILRTNVGLLQRTNNWSSFKKPVNTNPDDLINHRPPKQKKPNAFERWAFDCQVPS